MFSLAATGARPFHGVPLLGLAQFSLNGSLGWRIQPVDATH
jgi:hypothetical protein